MNLEQIYKTLKDLDMMDVVEGKFDDAREKGGLWWAVESHTGNVIFALQLLRLVRPLIMAYERAGNDEDSLSAWIMQVRMMRDETVRRLIDGHGRSNSTSTFQNAINQWEAEAMSRFVQMLGSAGLS